MERIQIRQDMRILPVSINGKDYDLSFSADLETQEAVISVMKKIMDYQNGLSKLEIDASSAEKTADRLSEILAYTSKGVDLAESMTGVLCEFLEGFGKAIEGINLDLRTIAMVASSMAVIMRDEDLVGKKVSRQMEGER